MADEHGTVVAWSGSGDALSGLVQEILSAVPGGCTWILPISDAHGRVVDFRIGAVSGGARDLHGRGASRVAARLSELYPSMVDGPLWALYRQVLATGVDGRLADYRYEERMAGIAADSLFDVRVAPLLGGLLVSWRRLDEDRRRLDATELLGRLGWAEYELASGAIDWSPGMYRILDRDPARGPMTLAEQMATLPAEDRGLVEAGWQLLDSGVASDITVRSLTDAGPRHLRILSDVARDADGTPLKVYSVVQDVTAREESRSEIERLSDQLRSRELTALAEHRLAVQVQNMIAPLPRETIALAGLEAAVGYQPAESALRVGGDWYHAQTLDDGSVVLAIGDVAGHGLEAAGGMASLRYSLIAWLSIGIRDPGTLLRHLNRLCGQLGITGTAAITRFDPVSRQLDWVRAGHLAPLLARDGVAESLDRPQGMLLGADPESDYPVRTVRLRPDDIVLLFTDGLVERRPGSTPSDARPRIDWVRSVLAEASAGPDRPDLEGLRRLLDSSSPDDDTCTLAVRVLP